MTVLVLDNHEASPFERGGDLSYDRGVVDAPVPSLLPGNSRESLYAELMAARDGAPVEDTLARILSSWLLGNGVLPDYLGLQASEFERLLETHFPCYPIQYIVNPGRSLDAQRKDEISDLHILLTNNRTGRCDSEIWMTDIVVAGCLGSDHLWQDLGLWQRADLSKLMLDNFEPLAKRNTKDMKWKKFLYKQLCETDGIYICRAPSCEVCADYHNCFGPE